MHIHALSCTYMPPPKKIHTFKKRPTHKYVKKKKPPLPPKKTLKNKITNAPSMTTTKHVTSEWLKGLEKRKKSPRATRPVIVGD